MKAITLHEKVARNFATQSSAALSIGLLAVAGLLIVLAVQPDHQLFKAAALAWVVLP